MYTRSHRKPRSSLKRAYNSRSRSRSYYRKPIKKVKRSIGKSIGRIAGSMIPMVGAENGAAIGGAIQKGIQSVFGSGDYHITPSFNIKSNSLLTSGNTPPQFVTGDRTTRVKHREYIGDVTSSTIFQIQNFYINPGLGSSFPWLCSVASNYECYRIKGMLFEYKSMSANALNSVNTALGTVIMATQYNAADANFISKQQMENYEYAQSCKPSESMLHYIECERGSMPLSELYIRTGVLGPNQSNQLYDIGEFFIGTQGMQQAGINIGELWVTYDIELLKPKLTNGQYGLNINYYHAVNSTQLPSTVNPFRNMNTQSATNFNITTSSADPTNLIFPSAFVTGIYQVKFLVYLTTAASDDITPGVWTAGNNIQILKAYKNDSQSQFGIEDPTKKFMINECIVQITGSNAVLQLVGFKPGTSATADTAELFIVQLNGNAN